MFPSYDSGDLAIAEKLQDSIQALVTLGRISRIHTEVVTPHPSPEENRPLFGVLTNIPSDDGAPIFFVVQHANIYAVRDNGEWQSHIGQDADLMRIAIQSFAGEIVSKDIKNATDFIKQNHTSSGINKCAKLQPCAPG